MLRDRSFCPLACELPKASLESGLEEARHPRPSFVTKCLWSDDRDVHGFGVLRTGTCPEEY